jgi:hypothetical protein
MTANTTTADESTPSDEPEHIVTGIEPAWVKEQYISSRHSGHEGTQPYPEYRANSTSINEAIDSLMDGAEYWCSCGEEFNSWHGVQEHFFQTDPNVPNTLTDEQKSRVIQDIVSLKAEGKNADSLRLSDSERDELITDLATLPSHELYSRWLTTVGEWLSHRSDIPPHSDSDSAPTFDSWLHQQWLNLLKDNPTDYFFVITEYITPDEVAEHQ